nr:hypothetical protein [Tanacetum cinerariifolium]
IKLHDIPIVTFTEDEMSVMATKLVLLKNDDELGDNGGNSNLAENGVASDMVDISHGKSTVEACTPNVASKMVNDLVNVHSKSKVDEVYNETTSFMVSTSSKVNKVSKIGRGMGNKRLYEQWKDTYDEDPYNEYRFDDCGLIDAQMAFANAFDISLHAFEKHLKDIHTLWTQFGKKRDRIATLLEDTQDMAYSSWRRHHKSL